MSYSAAIGQQLVMVQNDPAPVEFAEKTASYAEAKTVCFAALREEMTELSTPRHGENSDRSSSTTSLRRSRSLAENRKRHGRKDGDTTRALVSNADVERRGRNSSVLKKSKRPFTRISMGSTSRFISLVSRFVFAGGGAGFLSLSLPRKYRPPFRGFTLSKAAMPKFDQAPFCLSISKPTGRAMTLIRGFPSECSRRSWVM